ncbi:F sex factor family protein [Escherichia coli P0301867.3]|nr:F sex factor family protein [Escherichia coli 178900]END24369.1 F sex factor family protein [Escherichia coli P0301867.8]ENG90742.1 F sex factor family protein [Escherichia coli P0301867.3]ENG97573.1 F sex factor family protein [Escherichia coli P0301867.5]
MSFNAKDMTQGGQIASMRIRMFSQIANIMLYCLFIFFWILVGLVLWVKISWQTFVNGCIYWWCTTLEGMRDLIKSQPVYEIQYYGKTFRMNAAQVLHDKYMIWCGEQLWSAFVLASVVALVICLITFFVVSWILGRQGKQQSENEVTGGRQLTDNPKDVARMLKKDGKDSDIRIGDLLNRPGFPGECFICELRLPDHRFRWKHNKLFLLLPVGYGPAFPAIVDCYTSPPT